MDKRGSEAARAAWLYYVEELTQGEVAKELGVSRSTVVRLLRRAKESGLVRITLDVPQDVFEIERELERLYGLRRVRLVPDAGDEETLKRWLGHVGSEVLTEMVQPGSTVAVGWGTTLREITASLSGEQEIKDVKVVPLVGGLHRASSGTNSYWVAEQLGRYFRASAEALYAPLFVEDRSTAEALTKDPDIRNTVELVRQASLVLYSVGTLDDDSTIVKLGYLSDEQRAFLRERGAAGDIVCRWIDAHGDPVELPPTINPVGVTLEDLRNIPERLMVGGGESKREALLGALRGGYVTTLVTDDSTAAYLLERVTNLPDAPDAANRTASASQQ
ncbi:Transcriptional regulator contains sigma factor-related N-terminal domain [Rubrobacter radiotolerans]|uniref:Sugar-binding transcriptional regulator n=1 Tax=Rubrobacter radiotolerans TaxID=42256 RepID=A0A023X6A5_RUBRA|nr:sugar-binding transcriptional regulator [Rubrobacter radiotolerans]AHY47756.1 Transcriptional regulator contains sigma factor-related N-terminal domain [Rubrobacter radiotolerans]MDX5895232.1 sugar-binding transcriptional regulator [Rubrobacter radiotolerans]SMC07686.1 deoxyribonucleoside regulator [Rubrobacter radiotolerans DSM 5868]